MIGVINQIPTETMALNPRTFSGGVARSCFISVVPGQKALSFINSPRFEHSDSPFWSVLPGFEEVSLWFVSSGRTAAAPGEKRCSSLPGSVLN